MWDQRYSESGFAYGTSPNDFLVESSGDLIVGRTLCVAEGEGRNAVYLAGLGHNVTAVDQSLVGLKKAERLATDHGVVLTTVRSDLADYEIPTESFDCIVSIWCHVPRALRALLHQKFVSGLRPGGHLVLEAYTENQLGRGTGGPQVPELMMSLVDLRVELCGLRFLTERECERDIHEGKYHEGLSHVVQILAQK